MNNETNIKNAIVTHIAGALYNNCEMPVGDIDTGKTVGEYLQKHDLHIEAVNGSEVTVIAYMDDGEHEKFILTIA